MDGSARAFSNPQASFIDKGNLLMATLLVTRLYERSGAEVDYFEVLLSPSLADLRGVLRHTTCPP
jgi:hypothetical protein